MKKTNLAKALSLVFVCVMLLCALALTAFATEGENVDIVAANVNYGETYQIMYLVDAPEGATIEAKDSQGNTINVKPFGTGVYKGVEYPAYILEKGVAAQAIDEVITLSVEYNGKKATKNYSVLQYVYDRLYGTDNPAVGAEKTMFEALLDYATKADQYFNEISENPIENKPALNAYQYVTATGITVNGINPKGVYAPGVAPFANIDAIEYDAEKYELAITVNGETKTLDELKALVVGDTKIDVVVEIVEKAHEHSYTSVVTAPTCTKAGFTTYTCECGDSYTADEVPAVDHIDNDGDYKCDFEGCTVVLAPEADSVLTVEQALKLAALYAHNTYTTGKYYVTGTISKVVNTTYGNINIADGGKELYVYGLYSIDGSTRYDALKGKPAVNDVVTLYGVLGSYNKTLQMKNGWVQHNNDVVVTEPTCTDKGFTTSTCKYCGNVAISDETDALDHNFVEGECDRCGALDHEHNYTEVVTAPTCTKAGFTTYTCECGDSYDANEVEALGHIDENGDYKCDRTGCSNKVLPEAGSTLTISEALKICALYGSNAYTTGKYSVTGTIKSIYNTQYGNMYITDGEKELCIYGTYTADGSTRFDSMKDKPVVGDTITVLGVLGKYNTTLQMKNGWITEHEAHECDFTVEATCTKGVSCSICGAIQEGSSPIPHDFTYSPATCEAPAKCICGAKEEGSELGHELDADGKCTREGCDYQEGVESGPKELVTFEFGANGSAAHVDGNDLGTSKTYTENGYTLKLTNMSKVYGPAYDAKGNSTIKLGTSSKTGSFTFTVDDDVDQVIIRVAKYKSNTSKFTINGGTATTITTNSNDGNYMEVVIDTTTTKTITFATASGGVRAMIDSITFIG